MTTDVMEVETSSEPPSTSGRVPAEPAAAGPKDADAAAGAAAQSGAPRHGRGGRRRSASLDAAQPPKDEQWWLSDGEEESEGGGSGEDEDEELAAARLPLPPDQVDALYNPGADAEDEEWADAQRAGRPTDAILSCPGCFATVCLECQQHADLHTQYRAVFTVNCDVRGGAPMTVPTQRGGGGGGRRKRKEPEGGGGGGGGGGGEVMLPVCCGVCGTQVGAQDEDEVVHFYHVLASNP
ncbi:MAG: E2F-associated phosphoprotein-domain-containing protein [Monoraphidium minutum]|nr:MAG: E2F-associated phosphoprotein-domain-containing protein [Monoraphidium minutum]